MREKPERLPPTIEKAITALGRATTVSAVERAKRTLRLEIRKRFNAIRNAFEMSNRW